MELAAGLSLFTLPRRMGCSIAIVDEHYGHLAQDAERYEIGLVDSFEATYGDVRTPPTTPSN